MTIEYDPQPPPEIRIEHQIRDIRRENMQEADVTFEFDENTVIKELLSRRFHHHRLTGYSYSLSNMQNKFHGELIRKFMSRTA